MARENSDAHPVTEATIPDATREQNPEASAPCSAADESLSLGDETDPEALRAAHALQPPTRTRREHPTSQGLRPWRVVLGGFFLTVPTYGLLSAIGLFEPYWHEFVVADEHPPRSETDVVWILSVFAFLDNVFSAPVGILWDPTPTTIAYTIASQWFEPQGGGLDLAFGLISLGAPLGGIFFSLVLQALFARFGADWRSAGLALAAVLASCFAVAFFLIKTNPILPQPSSADLPSRPADEPTGATREVSKSVRTRGQNILCILKSMDFWLIAYAIFVYELVLIIQWGSIPLYAVTVEASSEQFYLMLSYNVGATFGRTVPPWLADRFLGPLNATLVMNLLTLLVVLALWLPLGTSSMAALFVVVVLMGVGTGSFVPLGVGCMNVLSTPETTATWLGLVYGVAAFAALVGNPISAAILARHRSNGLLAFLAAVLFSGMISAAALRWRRGDGRRASKAAGPHSS
ncbi:hypothetical protein VTJ83DRAFT_1967 [Remersonia thermophila]|uniref:MFS transporter n=1 Tax=Remersonia thermophila TaxID=72144 RepID=A0ABR4DHF4_9PEZI